MAVQRIPLYTPEQYLAMERAAPYKSEYFNGEIYAMAGASEAHNLINVVVAATLVFGLRGKPCRVYSNDMKVRVETTGAFVYPDTIVVCGPPRFDDGRLRDVLLNPLVLIEVLSPSTEGNDRGAKFAHYQRLASLQEYVLISQDKARVEIFRRAGDGGSGDGGMGGEWSYAAFDGLEAVAVFASLDGLALPLGDLYANVEFPPPSDVPPPGIFFADDTDTEKNKG